MFRSLALILIAAAPLWAQAFGFDDVAEMARRNAAAPWQAAQVPMPPALAALNYEGAREIRYRRSHAVWGDRPFALEFFHRAWRQTELVEVNVIEGGQVRRLPYESQAWDFGRLALDSSQFNEPGPAGFRVLHPLNQAGQVDELLVFLGASYFRALGQGQRYGLSARGLAIDTVGGGPEEFPRFTAFWIEQPAADGAQLVVHALLDSRRAAGAFQFTGNLTLCSDAVDALIAVIEAKNPGSAFAVAPVNSGNESCG